MIKKILTKEKRHEYYKAALTVIKSDVFYCICLTLDKVSNNTCYDYDQYWPEFAEQKPKNKAWLQTWFPDTKIGQAKRIAILKKCISKTKPTKK